MTNHWKHYCTRHGHPEPCPDCRSDDRWAIVVWVAMALFIGGILVMIFHSLATSAR